MSYMNDGCDPFGIPYIEYENKKTIKKEKDKPAERFTYDGGIIFDRDNWTEIWEAVNFLNELVKENEQLQQRNNRQAKQLDRIYQLIEEKDWRTLNDILDDFKRCEEQLQREWRTYE